MRKSLILFLGLALAGACVNAGRESPGSGSRDPAGSGADSTREVDFPVVRLEAFPEYLLGFPMVVALTIENPTEGTTWYDLPVASLFQAPGPFEFRLTLDSGGEIELPASSPMKGEEPIGGVSLKPGQSRRMLYDLSDFRSELRPGRGKLQAIYQLRAGRSPSNVVEVTIKAASEADAKIAAGIIGRNVSEEPSWARFVDEAAGAIDVSGLPDEARRFLALHLYLRDVATGKPGVADLSLQGQAAFDAGLLAGEASLCRLEILTARGDHRAADSTGADILSRWPGLKWRVGEIERGSGLLKALREKP